MNYNNHSKFFFLKEEIEKYIAKGEILGTIYLNNKYDLVTKASKIRRCVLGAVAFNHNINSDLEGEIYEQLENRFSISFSIGVGFDNVIYSQKCGCINEDNLIGQEIAHYCLEKGWIKK